MDRTDKASPQLDLANSTGVVRADTSLLDVHGHICAFFHSADEEFRVLLSFIREGLVRGERAFHIVDPARRDDHVRRLYDAGIDVGALMSCGQLEVRDWTQAHLRAGQFDAERMIEVVAESHAYAERNGFRRTRYITHMEWALAAGSLTEKLAEYEANANHSIPKRDDAVICVYDFPRWGGQTLVDALRTHPLVIIGGYLHDNPFFQPVAEFLGDVQSRRGESRPPAA